jgi:hypothetical protein
MRMATLPGVTDTREREFLWREDEKEKTSAGTIIRNVNRGQSSEKVRVPRVPEYPQPTVPPVPVLYDFLLFFFLLDMEFSYSVTLTVVTQILNIGVDGM